MSLRDIFPVFVLIALASISACNKEDAKPVGMPEGYERINAAFGFRPAGRSISAGWQQVPAVEFRSNGDYAMYPFATDCQGSFLRSQGLVFAADGTIREQLAEQEKASLDANPQFRAIADKVCGMPKPAMAETVDDENKQSTRFGELTIGGDEDHHQNHLYFENRTLYTGNVLSFVQGFSIGDADVVLVNDSTGGNGCPSGQYFFVALKSSSDVQLTPEFGNCYDEAPVVNQIDQRIIVSMPALGGVGSVTYAYANGEVIGDENAVSDAARLAAGLENEAVMDGDAHTATEDSALAAVEAAQAAQAAADEAASQNQAESGQRFRNQWMELCPSRSRSVSTPAGSQVGLSEEEATSYCGCLYSSAPTAVAAILAADGNFSAGDGGEWQAAHSQCIGRLM